MKSTARIEEKRTMEETPDLELMRESAHEAADLMKLLSHPDRLMVLCQLKMGERSVGELAEMVGVAQSPLSQHLARMRHENVVTTRREGQTIYYSLAHNQVERVVTVLYELYCNQDSC